MRSTLRHLPTRWLLAIAGLVLSSAAWAQPVAAKPPRPNPLDTTAAVPPAVHESAFTRYRTANELTLQPWKESNDTVGRIGGWRSYAREAANPEPPAAVAPAASAPAASAPPRSGNTHKHP